MRRADAVAKSTPNDRTARGLVGGAVGSVRAEPGTSVPQIEGIRQSCPGQLTGPSWTADEVRPHHRVGGLRWNLLEPTERCHTSALDNHIEAAKALVRLAEQHLRAARSQCLRGRDRLTSLAVSTSPPPRSPGARRAAEKAPRYSMRNPARARSTTVQSTVHPGAAPGPARQPPPIVAGVSTARRLTSSICPRHNRTARAGAISLR